ncbi:MAG: AbrB/MazE/SpoVT family DNA-binding domain-containing protein [Candidatus Dormibacteria bacterium]
MADALYRTRVGPGGRVVLPVRMRRAMNLQVGSELILAEASAGEWRLFTRSDALAQLQALVRDKVRADDSLVDELLAERRQESRRTR